MYSFFLTQKTKNIERIIEGQKTRTGEMLHDLIVEEYKRYDIQIISDIYYLREYPATFPVCGGFVFFHREYMYESV